MGKLPTGLYLRKKTTYSSNVGGLVTLTVIGLLIALIVNAVNEVVDWKYATVSVDYWA
jgi:hypothetical protein